MLEDCTNISECEKTLSLKIGKDMLIGQIALSYNDIDKLSELIKKVISDDRIHGIQNLKTKFPTCTACFLVWKGILEYKGGDYWSSISNSIGIDTNDQKGFGCLLYT